MNKTIRKHTKGFTLIELVIVIAILGILAGLAISRYIDMQEEARGATVLANMRTIESCAEVYAVKNGELPPRACPADTPENVKLFVTDYLAAWPVAPTPDQVFKVKGNDGKYYRYRVANDTVYYTWNGVYEKDNDKGLQRVTLGRWTIDNFENNTKPEGKSLIDNSLNN